MLASWTLEDFQAAVTEDEKYKGVSNINIKVRFYAFIIVQRYSWDVPSGIFAIQAIVPMSFSYDWQCCFFFVDVIQLIYEDQIERLKEKDLKEAKKRQRLGDNFLDLLYSIKVLIASIFGTQLFGHIKIVRLYVAKSTGLSYQGCTP